MTTYYANLNSGDDSLGGQSEADAFKTLATAKAALSNGDTLCLDAASHWRETLDLASLTGITVKGYGTGAGAIIDGADPVSPSEWTQDGTYNNCYWVQRTGLAGSASTAYQGAWQDGAWMPRAASLSACNSTPGTFFCEEFTLGSDYKLYIHPTGSGDPASNGSTYEIKARLYAIQSAGANCRIEGPITGKRAQYHDGSIRLAGANAYGSDLIASGGRHHNVYLNYGQLYRVACRGTESTGVSIVVNTTPGAGEVFLEDCVSQPVDLPGSGIYDHGGATASHYRRCQAEMIQATPNYAGQEFIWEDCVADYSGTNAGIKPFSVDGNGAPAYTAVWIRCRGRATNNNAASFWITTAPAGAKHLIYKCFGQGPLGIVRAYGMAPGSLVQIHGSTFVAGTKGTMIFNNDHAMSNTILYAPDPGGKCILNNDGSVETYTGSANLFYTTLRIADWYDGSQWNYYPYSAQGLTDWQSDMSTDADSQIGDPLFTVDLTTYTGDLSTLDLSTQSGSPAKTLQAGVADSPNTWTPPNWISAKAAGILRLTFGDPGVDAGAVYLAGPNAGQVYHAGAVAGEAHA